MKFVTALLLVFASHVLVARTIEVSQGGTYESLAPAAAVAQPGDTIVFRAGVYAGGQHIVNLQGNANAWITVMAGPGEQVILRGGGNAWQFSDAQYLRIRGFIIEEQTGNGFNVDDGGTIETPSHHIVIEQCRFRALNASGNNDQLKMSGIDSFMVADNIFQDGSAGGSMIDMVGCHFGVFADNIFERGGSNCIQAKGGTSYIIIERNRFTDGGARAINIGGSTGRQFFRPLDVFYEAAYIAVYSNVFSGAEAPIAFVGSVNCIVANNTFWLPGKWAFRILQETRDSGFIECGDNAFINNIVVLDNRAANPTINVGDATRPESFLYTNNLWFNRENASWGGPNLGAPQANGIIGRDPLLFQPPADMTPLSGSPAIGAGMDALEPVTDYRRRPFMTPRSIGAIEAGTSAIASELRDHFGVRVDGDVLSVELDPNLRGTIVSVYDLTGKLVRSQAIEEMRTRVVIDVADLSSGAYVVVVRGSSGSVERSVVVRR